ncbi:sulfurtransferase [Enterovibrio sp. ZSDZ35]|uniref:Sulfurtransferase n=1 Tax=Enterovibrio qingdaonensis TaxID=2899818 RepID=A0ABT5QFZ0_9GAMM|nr:sulfurtransferase [Enterovibrio sp. ZSDZ35]MDD1779613.1 sulfurtransferase [Enterovibrio sp. ZSDZ35]
MKLKNNVLVTADWLKSHLNEPFVKVVDATYFMPGTPRDALSEWKGKRIPSAEFFDYDTRICDKPSSLPHMLPSADTFSKEVGLLGIRNEDTVIVYDTAGIFSSPRVWWMFKVMGHENVFVLDGGLPAWEHANGEIDTSEPTRVEPTNYQATFDQTRVIDKSQLLEGINNGTVNVIDVRPNERFLGLVPEPREGVRSGHMPNAVNLPFAQLLEAGKFKSAETLKMLIESALSDSKRNVASCGSGVTACILAIAAEYASGDVVTVYDGSWTEWGSDHELPIVSGK